MSRYYYSVRAKDYYQKAIAQMILEEGMTDRGEIAEELGITRKALSSRIQRLNPELKMKILDKLEDSK